MPRELQLDHLLGLLAETMPYGNVPEIKRRLAVMYLIIHELNVDLEIDEEAVLQDPSWFHDWDGPISGRLEVISDEVLHEFGFTRAHF